MLKTDTSYRKNLHRILTDYIPQSVIEEGNAIAKNILYQRVSQTKKNGNGNTDIMRNMIW